MKNFRKRERFESIEHRFNPKNPVQDMLDDFARCDEAMEWLEKCGFNQKEIVDLNLNLFGV